MTPKQIRKVFLCHFCSAEFDDRSTLISHFVDCRDDRSTTEKNRIPRLNKTEQNILQILKLKRSNAGRSLRSKSKQNFVEKKTSSIFPFSEKSFLLKISEKNDAERPNKTNFCHFYRYSRREQIEFYRNVERARPKKIFEKKSKNFYFSKKIENRKFSIEIPTKIRFRQNFKSNKNKNFPLIFDPNFDSLVRISESFQMKNYSKTIEIFFDLLHSTASKEFQFIVNNDEHQRISFVSNRFSLFELFRESILNYSNSFKKKIYGNFSQNSSSSNENSVDLSRSTTNNESLDQKTSSTSKRKNVKNLSNRSEAKPTSLSSNQIYENWSSKNIFYRCHACFHEQFFLVASRECLKLHLSSKHAENEDNFKQNSSTFINKQGRSLKIIQHYLKWQQPWSENEVQRIFQLSDIQNR